MVHHDARGLGGSCPRPAVVVLVRVTIYGRMPVLEVLQDDAVEVDKVFVARNAHGESVDDIVAAARSRHVTLEMTTAERVTRVSRNGRHDQGVAADIRAPGLAELDEWLGSNTAGRAQVLLLDGVSNPANVGMIVRVATAAGMTGTVLPRFGNADVGPLVAKASAGTLFRATVLRAETAVDAAEQLRSAGFVLLGLRSEGSGSLFSMDLGERVGFVLGSETQGISPSVSRLIDEWVSIPLSNGVESLNVATAAAVLCYEVARRAMG